MFSSTSETDISTGKIQNSQLRMNGASTPPPGLQFTSTDYTTNGLASLHGINRIGATSAPPPPGFSTAPDQRNSRLSGREGQQGYLLNPADLTTNRDNSDRTRSKSFVNLAATLGNGLIESMNDSFSDQQQINDIISLNRSSVDQNRNNFDQSSLYRRSQEPVLRPNIDSIDRQSRHTASRLIGPTITSHGQDRYISPSLSNNNNREMNMQNRKNLGDRQINVLSKTASSSYLVSAPEDTSITSFLDSVSTEKIKSQIGMTIVEPSSIPKNALTSTIQQSPIDLSKQMPNTKNNFIKQAHLHHPKVEEAGGRSSAPPQVLDHQYKEYENNSVNMRYESLSSQPHFSDSTPAYTGTTKSDFLLEQQRLAEEDILPFIWNVEEHSSGSNYSGRALAILYASSLHVPDVRITCEAFGSLLFFRADFCNNRGIILVGYHDMRCARHAAIELEKWLTNLATRQDSLRERNRVKVMYCVSLNSSLQRDDSMLYLSNLPSNIKHEHILSMMSAYGAVRSVQFHVEEIGVHGRDQDAYVVEFYDDQDANQTLLEIKNISPWGPEVFICLKDRTARQREQGQALLALLSRWRHGEKNWMTDSTVSSSFSPRSQNFASRRNSIMRDLPSSPNSPKLHAYDDVSKTHSSHPSHTVGIHPPGSVPPYHPISQLMVGPDGRYSYVIVNPSFNDVSTASYVQPGQHLVNAPHNSYGDSIAQPANVYNNGQNYWTHPTQPHVPATPSQSIMAYHHDAAGRIVPNPSFVDIQSHPVFPNYYSPSSTRVNNINLEQSSNNTSGCERSSSDSKKTMAISSRNSMGQAPKMSGISNQPNNLAFDINKVIHGNDTRSSIMIRNIPNKYTQSMLLSEFVDYGHGPEMIDFFYLPIDFKNKCNRGYAFVNFANYSDIVTFHEQYNAKHWKVFNSDKICEITYARIQGKSGMLKRFQNSALLEKDAEYRPIVFISHGPNKGKRENFPSS